MVGTYAAVSSANTTTMGGYVLYLDAASGDDPVQENAQDDRMLLDAIFQSPGYVSSISNALQVTQHSTGANATLVDVQPGHIVLPSKYSGGGKYLASLSGVLELTIPPPPSSGTQTHNIVAYALDKADAGDSEYGWVIDPLVDTGAGTPATPSYAVSLAYISRTAGTTAITSGAIADKRQAAATGAGGLAGGVQRNSTTGSNPQHFAVISYTGGALNLANVAVAVNVQAGHKYAVDVSARVTNDYSTANLQVAAYFRITTDGGSTFPTAPNEYITNALPYNIGYAQQFTMYYDAPSTGSVTFSLMMKAFPMPGFGGSAQISIYPPSSIIVRDLGLSSAVGAV